MNVFKKIGGGVRFLWKRCRAFTITGTSLIALLLAVNLIILQVPLISNTFNTIFGEGGRVLQSGDPGTAEYFTPTEGIGTKSDALAAANAVNERICAEGFVLLKNDGALPLGNYDKISVFGMNSVDLVYGGTGSAEKDSGDSVDLYKSLADSGIAYNPELKRFYDNQKAAGKGRPKSPSMGDILTGFAIGELALSEYAGGLDAYVGDYTDAALMVVWVKSAA